MRKENRSDKVSEYINLINKERLLNTFIELARIKSSSKNEKEAADFVAERLHKAGLEVLRDDCGKKIGCSSGNIIAFLGSSKRAETRLRPEKKEKNKYGLLKEIPIFLGAHLDTVGLRGDVIPVIKKGRIINENKQCILGGDDKVGVAAILEALSIIKEKNLDTGDIYIIFTVSEEIGILGAKNLDLKFIKAKYGFVFDGKGDIGTIFNEAPYHNSIDIKIIGKACHAGVEPEKGISSIKIAALAISQLKLGRIDYETTCNIGKINGGVATNIVPELTEIKGEVRSLKEEKLEKITKNIVSVFRKTADDYKARIKFKIEREYEGFKISDNEIPVRIAKKAISNLGIKPKIVSTGGGSDINIFNSRGKKAINFSSGMENVHSNKEYVKISQIEKLAALIIEICTINTEKL